MNRAICDAILLYGENWYRLCSIRAVGATYAVFACPPSNRAFRRGVK